MAWPLVQIVDNLEYGRVLFDFNPGRSSEFGRWFTKQEASPLGEPSWDSSVVGIVDGSRTLRLPLRFTGRQAEPAMAVLSEILTRSVPVYLQFQPRADSSPVWFRLRRQTAGGALDFTQMFPGDVDNSMWQWTVSLEADAFALGARQDLTPTSQLAIAGAASKPPVEIMDPILGDAPAPLCMDIDAGDLTGYRTQLMSWAMDPAATVDPWAGTTALDMPLTGTETGRIGSLEQIPPPGQFRCLLYAKRTTTYNTSKFQVSVDDGYGLPLISTPQVIVAPDAGVWDGRWIDCGRINLPAGVNFIGLPEDALGEIDWTVGVESTSSTGVWQVSNFMLIPVQTVSSRAATTVLSAQLNRWPGGVLMPSATPGLLRVDAERSRVGIVEQDSGKWIIALPPVVDGAFPRVHPGARNFLMFLPRTNNIGVHGYGTSGPTTMWYYPRYLHIGGR